MYSSNVCSYFGFIVDERDVTDISCVPVHECCPISSAPSNVADMQPNMSQDSLHSSDNVLFVCLFQVIMTDKAEAATEEYVFKSKYKDKNFWLLYMHIS